ncbi:PucR family transcriptional regulator [Pseudonocardia sp. TRM90224]|uniref:PucR family transcriptional regulator n=1 Tax=Pseudonocardia sp. TRM90224 TaxID=2812678 RepID=UPI001E5E391F|nr:helix-turn-helix domain-containing protein [Pseudonocardia sp. TRM90224]
MDAPEPSLHALVTVLAERLPDLLDDVCAALDVNWPDYAWFLTENRLQVSLAVEPVLKRLVLLAGEDGDITGDVSEAEHELFEQIGRMQWRHGKELTALLSAYQAGARVFWHHVSTVAVEAGVPPRTIAALAEAVFAFVDTLSSSSARGFVLEQSEAAATRERLREELVGLLLSDRADHAAVAAAAERAEWPVPDEVAVVLVDPEHPSALQVLARLPSTHLVFNRSPLLGAIMPWPSRPGRRQQVVAALNGVPAVIGLPVSPDRLPASMRIAETAARLQHDGVIAGDPLVADEHLDAIIVHRDAWLLDTLRREVLRPLAGTSAGSRERLSETLVSWLWHMGDRRAVAAQLHVHPQTVRYRLAKLHELFGESLDDPATRARLVLALGWGEPRRPH